MKKGILLLLLISSVFVHAQQTLKDALFSGKLKSDTGTVIRKGEDLTSKIDTARKATVDPVKTKPTLVVSDSLKKGVTNQTPPTDDTAVTDSVATTTNVSKQNSTGAKNNTAIWKDYMANIISVLKTEVLPSKKIKKDTYSVSVSYSIAIDGQTTVTDVSIYPENPFLQQQIKDRLAQDTPRLNPVLSDSGAPRKTNKKYNFSIEKE